MLFSSLTFIFIFLPIVCAVYFLVAPKLRNYVLLMASIAFYAWGEPRYLWIMFATIIINYIGAIYIGRERHAHIKKCLLVLFLILDLGFLFYFKYLNFILENLSLLLQHKIDFTAVLLPLGISFYTFQSMSYLIDVYRREAVPQKSLYKVALYICLFPQLIAGPIVKYHEIDKQIDKRILSFSDVLYGVRRFIVGLAKKMLIANILGGVGAKILALPVEEFSTGIAWLGAFCCTLQVYFDFSGYSDMAIGLGRIFGFKFPENFNYPYISKSMSEYWRRWHISLSTWFKFYLYFPLGGSRVAPWRAYCNLYLTFLLIGIWHGASWAFFIWGSWNGLCVMFEKYTRLHKIESSKWYVSTGLHLYTIFCFTIARILFMAKDLDYAWGYFKNMFGFIPHLVTEHELSYYMNQYEICIFIIGIICSLPLFKNLLSVSQEYKWRNFLLNIWLGILFLLSSCAAAVQTYNPFIYFRF